MSTIVCKRPKNYPSKNNHLSGRSWSKTMASRRVAFDVITQCSLNLCCAIYTIRRVYNISELIMWYILLCMISIRISINLIFNSTKHASIHLPNAILNAGFIKLKSEAILMLSCLNWQPILWEFECRFISSVNRAGYFWHDNFHNCVGFMTMTLKRICVIHLKK